MPHITRCTCSLLAVVLLSAVLVGFSPLSASAAAKARLVDATLLVGQAATVVGDMGKVARPVRLQVRRGGKWRIVARAKSSADGRFTLTDSKSRAARYRVKAPRTKVGGRIYKKWRSPAMRTKWQTTIRAGEALNSGRGMRSGDGRYIARMQTDGNFVVYDRSQSPGKALWNSGTNGTGADRIVMQGDGNLVVYAGPTAQWDSRTHPASAARLAMQNDGNLVVYSRGGIALWSSKGGKTPNTQNALFAGSTLRANRALWSKSTRYVARVQTDGNFVIYDRSQKPAKSIWNSRTAGTGINRITVQGDGNVVAYDGGTAKWSTGTRGTNVRFIMQDDGALVLYSRGGLPLWSSKGGKTGFAEHTLPRGTTLSRGKGLWSSDGRFFAVMQSDGNFVVYGPNGAKWASGTNGSGADRVVMQTDGNLVIYDGSTAEWNSGTQGSNTRLVMQGDGNLVVYDGGTAKWSSNDNGAPGSETIDSASAITRAQSWVDEQVPYSQSLWHTNGYGTYRQDCSGYVSLAWGLGSSLTTFTLPQVSHEITKANLRAGDILLSSGHTLLFHKWANDAKSEYWAYEQIKPGRVATYRKVPYPYWDGYGTYLPYRKN